MICKNCGHRISGAAPFCSHCGRNNRTGEMPKSQEPETENSAPLEENAVLESAKPIDETTKESKAEETEKAEPKSVGVAVAEPETSSVLENRNYALPVYFAPVYPPMYGEQKANGKAIASLVLGIVSAVMWLVSLVGIPTSIIGLILGAQARKQSPANSGLGTAGMVLCIIFLCFACLFLLAQLLFVWLGSSISAVWY